MNDAPDPVNPITVDQTATRAPRDVLCERFRQIHAEGFSAAHDDLHVGGELIRAAVSYAASALSDAHSALSAPPPGWPWERAWWNPKDRRSDLVRAAALLIGEIERMDRAEARRAPDEQTSTPDSKRTQP